MYFRSMGFLGTLGRCWAPRRGWGARPGPTGAQEPESPGPCLKRAILTMLVTPSTSAPSPGFLAGVRRHLMVMSTKPATIRRCGVRVYVPTTPAPTRLLGCCELLQDQTYRTSGWSGRCSQHGHGISWQGERRSIISEDLTPLPSQSTSRPCRFFPGLPVDRGERFPKDARLRERDFFLERGATRPLKLGDVTAPPCARGKRAAPVCFRRSLICLAPPIPRRRKPPGAGTAMSRR